MKSTIKSTFVITAFMFVGLMVTFISQIVIANFFGAKPELDAFIAASSLPQYIIAVLIAILGSVFIPVFMDYKAKESNDRLWIFASNAINFCFVIFGTMTLAAIIFAKPLLHLIAPGLKPEFVEIGARISIILWPSVLASAIVIFLSSIYQAKGKFGWQAAVPVVGSLAGLGILLIAAPRLGILGLAFATTANAALQVFLLMRVITKNKRYRFTLNWREPGIQQMFLLFLPLVIIRLFSKLTPLVERYLASGMQEGSISHLNYAFKIISIVSMLISTGLITVIFPRLASDVSSKDRNLIRNTMSKSLRIIWFCVAPVVAIGFSLVLPLVTIFFQRGEFGHNDSVIVSGLLRIYLLALGGMCLGNITGRCFYALKDTKTLAVFGIPETIIYVIYAVLLAKWFGIRGIALAYAIYFNVSILWQLAVLRIKTGGAGGRGIFMSFAKISFSAVLAGFTTYFAAGIIKDAAFTQLIIAALSGFAVYVLLLHLMRSDETKIIWRQLSKSC